MAPSVTVSFTSNVQSGDSPLQVQFTDETVVTNGFPRLWLWDFGDGTISESQNPSHTYTGDPRQSFTVTLAVLATTGEFDVLSTVIFGIERVSNDRLVGVDAVLEDAWTARADTPLDDPGVYHTLNWNGAQYSYFTNDVTMILKTNSSDLAFVLVEMHISPSAGIGIIEGFVDVREIQTAPTIVNVWEVHSRLPEVTASNPITTTVEVVPEVPLVWSGAKIGINVTLRTKTYPNTGTQSFGEAAGSIQIGNPNIDFVGTPLIGTSPLAVQFTDLSSVDHAYSVWDFGDGNIATFAGETHPLNTYTTDGCSIDLL